MLTTTVKENVSGRKSRAGTKPAGGGGLWPPGTDPLRMVRLVQAGFPYARLVRFQKVTSLPWETIAQWVQIPMRTLTRRRSEGRLRADESDRLLRAATVFGKAVDLFEGDVGAARRWLQTPQHGLAGELPLELASTEVGARQVEYLIARLEHGVFT